MNEAELIEKNRSLLARREKKPIAPVGNIEKDIADALKNLNVLPDAEADKLAQMVTFKIDIQRLLDVSGIPKRHRVRSVSAVDKFSVWSKKFRDIEARLGSGLLVALVGIYGNGKTQMGVEMIKLNAKRGVRSLFATAEDFFAEIKASYQTGATSSEREIVERFRKPKLVVIDEIGANSAKEWEMRPLFQLLNHRYNDQKDTIIISNCTAEELFAVLGPKIKSRMKESGLIVDCNWPSFR